MFVRTITASLVPGKAEEATRIFTEQILPEIRKQPGYVSTALYIDRPGLRAQTVSIWTDATSESATSEGTTYLQKAVGMLSGCIANREVAHWEVAAIDPA